MVMLRATQKVLHGLPQSTVAAGTSDTALGDWYVSRLVVDRQPLLIAISSLSYLPVLVPARELATLPERLPDLVASRLRRLRVPTDLIAAEVAAMTPVVLGPTCDRSVLGILVDFSKTIPYHLPMDEWDLTTLPFVEQQLARTPCHAGRRFEDVIFPNSKAPSLLSARWQSAASAGCLPSQGGSDG
jgi:uncharacterized protein DUF6933